jgi:hypothetical protein
MFWTFDHQKGFIYPKESKSPQRESMCPPELCLHCLDGKQVYELMIVVKRQLEISVIILNKSGGLAAFEGPCEIGHSNNRLDY